MCVYSSEVQSKMLLLSVIGERCDQKCSVSSQQSQAREH